jgi:hypothetical protein
MIPEVGTPLTANAIREFVATTFTTLSSFKCAASATVIAFA